MLHTHTITITITVCCRTERRYDAYRRTAAQTGQQTKPNRRTKYLANPVVAPVYRLTAVPPFSPLGQLVGKGRNTGVCSEILNWSIQFCSDDDVPHVFALLAPLTRGTRHWTAL
ncbi:hypothetical protein V492_02603 [Pseudogymnoascus sp. VKM F-4246]|nr:hypothetical protein V492_02603 [Pseudogymnoascus sp. VKM F-4246]